MSCLTACSVGWAHGEGSCQCRFRSKPIREHLHTHINTHSRVYFKKKIVFKFWQEYVLVGQVVFYQQQQRCTCHKSGAWMRMRMRIMIIIIMRITHTIYPQSTCRNTADIPAWLETGFQVKSTFFSIRLWSCVVQLWELRRTSDQLLIQFSSSSVQRWRTHFYGSTWLHFELWSSELRMCYGHALLDTAKNHWCAAPAIWNNEFGSAAVLLLQCGWKGLFFRGRMLLASKYERKSLCQKQLAGFEYPYRDTY